MHKLGNLSASLLNSYAPGKATGERCAGYECCTWLVEEPGKGVTPSASVG